MSPGRSADDLPQPADYYAGAPGWAGGPPRNILVFRRTRAQAARTEEIQMHPRHVLCLCLAGPGTLTVEGTAMGLRPGRGLLLFPFEQHHLSGFAAEQIDWLFVSFDLDGPPALERLRDRPFALTGAARTHLDHVVGSYRAHLRGAARRGADITAWLMLLLGGLAGPATRGAESPAGGGRLGKAVRHIYANLRQPFRIQACARVASLSPSHLRRLFRKQLGCSLGRYVRQARIHQATALLHQTDLSVTEIAEACGFGSIYAFSRAFAAAKGHPPTAHRARLRR